MTSVNHVPCWGHLGKGLDRVREGTLKRGVLESRTYVEHVDGFITQALERLVSFLLRWLYRCTHKDSTSRINL